MNHVAERVALCSNLVLLRRDGLDWKCGVASYVIRSSNSR